MTDEELLALYDAALEAILIRGQSYTIGDRTLTRADVRWITAERDKVRRRVNRKARGGIRMRYGTPQG